MIELLRWKIMSFIEKDPDDYHIKDDILSDYCSNVLRWWRYITDQSWWYNDDKTLQFLSFWVDVVWTEDDKYTTAFTSIKFH